MNSELILFYNVENFFPADTEGQENFHSGLYNWTPYKYNLKVHKITNVFRFVEEDYGRLPSIIGLAEIGALSVLEDLKKENSPIESYEIIYKKSQDSRGLSVAMLYDKSRLELIKHETLQFNPDESKAYETRDILQAEFAIEDTNFHVFVVHLPSKRENDAKKDHRNYICEQLHNILKELYKREEPIIVMGDFNENPDGESITKMLYDEDHHKVLTNTYESLFQARQFSSFHGKTGVVFDQILYSEKLLKDKLNYQNLSAEIYNTVRLRNKQGKNNKYPSRTYSGSRYMGGYSDHFPVILKMEKL